MAMGIEMLGKSLGIDFTQIQADFQKLVSGVTATLNQLDEKIKTIQEGQRQIQVQQNRIEKMLEELIVKNDGNQIVLMTAINTMQNNLGIVINAIKILPVKIFEYQEDAWKMKSKPGQPNQPQPQLVQPQPPNQTQAQPQPQPNQPQPQQTVQPPL